MFNHGFLVGNQEKSLYTNTGEMCVFLLPSRTGTTTYGDTLPVPNGPWEVSSKGPVDQRDRGRTNVRVFSVRVNERPWKRSEVDQSEV